MTTMVTAGPVFLLCDKRKSGWSLLKHTLRCLTSDVDASLLLEGSKACHDRTFTKLDDKYGQEDAEWLMEHQSGIPAELQERNLVFSGTVWEVVGGFRRCPYLYCQNGKWYLDFTWFGT